MHTSVQSELVLIRAHGFVLMDRSLSALARRDIWGTTPRVSIQPGLFTAQTLIREGGVRDIQIYGNRELRQRETVSPVFLRIACERLKAEGKYVVVAELCG